MSNSKISALSSATTPLAGSEIVPVNQSGVTNSVSVANLTAGRAVSAASLALTTSPLSVTSGGTGTATALGAGSVVFTDSSGIFSSNNGSFFWDNSNQRLGLGTNTPARRLEVAGLTGGVPLRLTNTNGNTGIEMLTAATKYSWFTGAQYNLDQTYEITTSTANGGTTFTNILVTVEASSGNVTNKQGNFVPATAGKGVNFTANTPASGMTSQNLTWYEEGTWTPTQGSGLTVVGTFSSSGKYTRIGRTVNLIGQVSGTTSVAITTGNPFCGGLPFTVGSSNSAGVGSSFNASLNSGGQIIAGNGGTNLYGTAVAATTAIYFTVTYFV